MELRLLIILILFNYLSAQDVEIPDDLLKPKTTTEKETTDINDYDEQTTHAIQIPTEIVTTTTKSPQLEDTTKSSWISNGNEDIPISEQLIDNSIPLYYPQYQNMYQPFIQQPLFQSPCNQNPNNQFPTNQFPINRFPNNQFPNNQFPQPIWPISHPFTPISPPISPISETFSPKMDPIHPQFPVTAPPIFDSSTFEPEVEEIFECPIGFLKNDSKCIPIFSNDCPSDFVWKDDRCVLSKTDCPLNFDFDGTSCVERQVCPPNHTSLDGKCIAPEPECMFGWRWNGYTCETINIECPSGFIVKGRECVLEEIACPDGQQLIDDQCVKPKVKCPPGFELQESGFCHQINKKCPPGTILVDGNCQKNIIKCLPGYEKIGDHCYQIIQETTSLPTPLPIQTTTTASATTTIPIIFDVPTIVNPPDIETSTMTIIPQPPPRICPDQFIYYNGQCYKCPIGYNLCSGNCYRNTQAPCQRPIPQPYPYPQPNYPIPKIDIHLTIPHEHNPFQPPPTNHKPVNIVNKIEPVNNTIHNVNNVTHPVTLNNVNENNIYVYMDSQCADGKIRTTIIKNNQTILGCEDDNTNEKLEKTTSPPKKDPEFREDNDDDDDDQEEEKPKKCCEIVTPRRCKKRFTTQWMCIHRRYKHCGDICIATRLYVKPPATIWANQILTIAPNPSQTYIKPCFGQECPPVDCSGCIDGSYNCSPQCYTYPCYGDGCTFINQDKFCENVTDKDFCER